MQVSLKPKKKLSSTIARITVAVAFVLMIGSFGTGTAHAGHGHDGDHRGGGSYHRGGGYHGGGLSRRLTTEAATTDAAATGEAVADTGAVGCPQAIRTTTTHLHLIITARGLSIPIRRPGAPAFSLDSNSAKTSERPKLRVR